MAPPATIKLAAQRRPKAATQAKRKAGAGRGGGRKGARRKRLPPRGTQLRLPERCHGGRRDGAGRPHKPGSGVAHLSRAKLTRHQPVHVSWRVVDALPSLRRPRLTRVIVAAFNKGCDRFGMRLVHFSVQRGHMHLICEATDEKALSRGLQGLGIRVAKALNRALERKGKVFADRFFSRVLNTPREVRNALGYVLGNLRRHALERSELLPEGALDPCSSARLFDGYRDREKARVVRAWMEPPVPVAPASCWLLKTGWRRHGLLGVDDIPGPRARKRRHRKR